MSEPTSQTVEPSRTHPAVPTLLTLAGLMGGFYLLLISALPISPLTGVDWLILTLTTIAIIWGFSVILLATGFSAALLLGVLRRTTLKKKHTRQPYPSQRPRQNPHPRRKQSQPCLNPT